MHIFKSWKRILGKQKKKKPRILLSQMAAWVQISITVHFYHLLWCPNTCKTIFSKNRWPLTSDDWPASPRNLITNTNTLANVNAGLLALLYCESPKGKQRRLQEHHSERNMNFMFSNHLLPSRRVSSSVYGGQHSSKVTKHARRWLQKNICV